MGIIKRALLKKRIKRWRNELTLDEHGKAFNELYQGSDGYGLSRKAREGNDALEYVYGEIEFDSFIALINLCKPNQDTVFYDLGSGTGKAVIAAAMVFGLRKSAGIEYFQELNDYALLQKSRLAAIPAYKKTAEAISLEQGDFLTHSLKDADLIFMNSTAFFGDYWAKISKHLEQELKPGAIVLSASKSVVSDAFEVKHSTEVGMGWGVVTIYVQEHL